MPRIDDKMAGMEQVKSHSQCQDMADTGRCGTNAVWHLMPHNAPIQRRRKAPSAEPVVSWLSLHLLHSRYLPSAVEDGRRFFRRPVKAKHEDESTRGCWKPVGLFLRAGVVVLQVKIHRSIRIRLKCVPSAERI